MEDTNVAFLVIDSEEANVSSDNLEEEIYKGNINPKYKFATAKKILYFTSNFGMDDWMFGFGNQPFLDHKCPVTNCYITNKRDNICKYIAVYYFIIFYHRPFNKTWSANFLINYNVKPPIVFQL